MVVRGDRLSEVKDKGKAKRKVLNCSACQLGTGKLVVAQNCNEGDLDGIRKK